MATLNNHNSKKPLIFKLTNLEIFQINKKLPRGIQLDHLENYYKIKKKVVNQEKIEENSEIKNISSQKEKELIEPPKIKPETSKPNVNVEKDITDEKMEVNLFCQSIFTGLKMKMTKLKIDRTEFDPIESKLKEMKYETEFMFSMDVRKVFTKIFQKLTPESEIYNKNLELSNLFEDLLIKANLFLEEAKKLRKPDSNIKQIQEIKEIPTKSSNKKEVKEFSIVEKQILGENIRKLNKENIRKVLKIFEKFLKYDNELNSFELDLEDLDFKNLKELQTYVEASLITQNKEKMIKERSLIMKIEEDLAEKMKIEKLKEDLVETKDMKSSGKNQRNYFDFTNATNKLNTELKNNLNSSSIGIDNFNIGDMKSFQDNFSPNFNHVSDINETFGHTISSFQKKKMIDLFYPDNT